MKGFLLRQKIAVRSSLIVATGLIAAVLLSSCDTTEIGGRRGPGEEEEEEQSQESFRLEATVEGSEAATPPSVTCLVSWEGEVQGESVEQTTRICSGEQEDDQEESDQEEPEGGDSELSFSREGLSRLDATCQHFEEKGRLLLRVYDGRGNLVEREEASGFFARTSAQIEAAR